MDETKENYQKLSIIIPVYNEQKTLQQVIDMIAAVELPLKKEIVLVDDYSTDGSRELIESGIQIEGEQLVKVFHSVNQGKGAALRSGFKAATGDIVLIQDADLEYNPQEYHRLLAPIIDGRADVVYGSRFVGSDAHRVHLFWHMVGNRILTLASNMLTNLNLTDMETCYKVFRKPILDTISICENRFGFEPEITAKIAKQRCKIYEVGISYNGRSYEEGKKIGWKDGVRAFWCIVKYNMLRY